LNEFDGEIERLKSLQDDKRTTSLYVAYEPFYETNWQVKSVGDLQVYNPAKDDGTAGVYGVTVLRNYLWPGALTVAYVTLHLTSALLVCQPLRRVRTETHLIEFRAHRPQ
jgi:hypothetical protein